jgi:sugar diacid utilization regulator
VLAIVVDDLGLSFESTAYVRQMLTRYVDTNVGPGDLVAIIRTAAGVGTLQQFTTDRRLLHAAGFRYRLHRIESITGGTLRSYTHLFDILASMRLLSRRRA